MGIILILVKKESIIFLQMEIMHLNSNFSLILSMIHVRDVINSSINESVQKTFAGDHFEMVHKTWILIVFLGSLHLRAEVQRMSFHRTLSEGQNFSRGTISNVLIKILLFWAHITQRGVIQRFKPLLMSIGWWVTWYDHQHFLTTYCYGNFSRNLLNMHL